MHMDDSLLSNATCAAMYAVSAAAVVYSAVKMKKDGFDEKKGIVAGAACAAIFAVQAVNYAIPGTGSSGHLLGAVALAALVGAAPAMLVMAAVLTVQSIGFGDGGVMALGANIFNVGVIPCLLVYPFIFKPLMKGAVSAGKTITASVTASIAALLIGAFAVVLQTQASGITALPFAEFTKAMLPIHLVIGLVEGAVTAAVLCLVYRSRPEIMTSTLGKTIMPEVRVGKIAAIFAAAALIVTCLIPLGSEAPDGLEWSIEKVAGDAFE